jgi:hypothetical protein
MKALKPIIMHMMTKKDLSTANFENMLNKANFKTLFKRAEARMHDLTSDNYSPSAANAKRLCNDLLKAMGIIDELKIY